MKLNYIGGKRTDLNNFKNKFFKNKAINLKKYSKFSCFYYSRGNNAFSEIINFFLSDKKIILHLPIQNCNKSLLNNIKKNKNIIFFYYRTKKELLANYKQNLNYKNIVLIVDYAGITDFSELIIKRKNIKYILDSANSFFDMSLIDEYYETFDFIFFSFRKFLPCSDGALLFSKYNHEKLNFINFHYYIWEFLIFCNKFIIIELLIDKLGIRRYLLNKHENKISIRNCSQLGKNIFLKTDFKKLSKLRLNNYYYYDRNINESFKQKLFFKKRSSKISPLYYPIRTDNCLILQNFLAKFNIYCPVFWSELKLSDQFLGLPIDDRMTLNDLNYVVKKINDFSKIHKNLRI